MSVKTNPYRNWENKRKNSDYRSRETQSSALTRQMLSQPEYLLDRNRVDPGPSQNLRAHVADAQPQIPHDTLNEDIWGWQPWSDQDYNLIRSPSSNNLLEETDIGEGAYKQITQPTYTAPDSQPKPLEYICSTYVHKQTFSSTVWVINHNLGFRPSVELLDSGNQEIEGSVSHPSVNQTLILLNPATSGLARLT